MSAKSHLLVVDDDTKLCELLKKFLVKNGYIVTAVTSGVQALRLTEGLSFDLIILDVMMPDLTGYELAERVRESHDVPIIFLTAKTEPEDRIQAFESGGDDYLAKPFEPRELIMRIQAILRRSQKDDTPQDRVMFGEFIFDKKERILRRGEERVALTPSERAVLGALAAAPNEDVSRGEIAEAMRKVTADVQERAVDVQITRIRRKIDDDSKMPRHLLTVRGTGYRLVADPCA